MKPVLVTGSSGFVGGHLVEKLKTEGYIVDGLDKNEPTRIVPCDHFIHKDILTINEKDVPWLKKYGTIYHLAAETGLSASKTWLRESRQAYQVNAEGTLNLIKYSNPDLFVFTSTAALYGEGKQLTEMDPLRCCNSYGYSKAVAERLIEASGVPYVIYRPGTIVGPHGRSYINRLVYECVNGIKSKVFNGGFNRRSFIDVVDVVNALWVAPSISCGIYNLSVGCEHMVRDIIRRMEKMDPLFVEPEYVDYCPSGLARYVTLNNGKLLHTGKWRPMVGLGEMLDKLYDYYKNGGVAPPEWGE